jgi:hypothetical protein
MSDLQIRPECLGEFPKCPRCGTHGRVSWRKWWAGTEYMEGRVECSNCGWFDPRTEPIEVGLGAGEIFIPSALQDWIDAARRAGTSIAEAPK